MNLDAIDPSFPASLRVNMDADVFAHFAPYLTKLGEAAGSLAKSNADPPVLEHRVEPVDPLAPPDGAWEHAAYACLLDDSRAPTLAEAGELLSLQRSFA